MAGGRTGAAQGALNAGRDVLHAISGQAPPSQYIRAYHGSPYDWNRVDMSMIGKGEGPLDEGVGLYASSAEAAANWYRGHTTRIRRDMLAEQLRTIRKDADAAPSQPHPPGRELDWLRRVQNARRLSEEIRPQLQRLQRQHPRGRTYELEIGYPRDSLIEYDVPVYAQQPDVLARMRDVDRGLVDDFIAAGRDGLDGADGAMFYHALSGGTVLDSPSIRGQRAASEALFNAGIPGHAYSGARGQTNFVLYPGTEDKIRILRKFGLMAPIAAGAMEDQ
jgi:hypothetical protein